MFDTILIIIEPSLLHTELAQVIIIMHVSNVYRPSRFNWLEMRPGPFASWLSRMLHVLIILVAIAIFITVFIIISLLDSASHSLLRYDYIA